MPSEILYQHAGCMLLLSRAAVTAVGFSHTPGAHREGGFGQSASIPVLGKAGSLLCCWRPLQGGLLPGNTHVPGLLCEIKTLILLRAHRGTALIATWIIHLKLVPNTKTGTSSK